MPNPVRLVARDGATVYTTKNATQKQRVSLTRDGEDKPQYIFEVPDKPEFPISTGVWWVLHETHLGGKWQKGLGRNSGDYIAEFDDNPKGTGDNDYNDCRVIFRV